MANSNKLWSHTLGVRSICLVHIAYRKIYSNLWSLFTFIYNRSTGMNFIYISQVCFCYLNIWIDFFFDAKCWLVDMTLVMTSLPCLHFALVSASRWLAKIWQLSRQGATGNSKFSFFRRAAFQPRRACSEAITKCTRFTITLHIHLTLRLCENLHISAQCSGTYGENSSSKKVF